MNLFSRFEQDDSFSSAERILIHCLISHGEEISSLSVSQIELECAVSRASIYRFISKCGYPGFITFQMALYDDYHGWIAAQTRLDADYPFAPGTPHSKLLPNFWMTLL